VQGTLRVVGCGKCEIFRYIQSAADGFLLRALQLLGKPVSSQGYVPRLQTGVHTTIVKLTAVGLVYLKNEYGTIQLEDVNRDNSDRRGVSTTTSVCRHATYTWCPSHLTWLPITGQELGSRGMCKTFQLSFKEGFSGDDR